MSCSSVAARVAATVVRIPPAAYGSPAIRAANSCARSPAKTRWLWLSTKPGSTARPPASTTSSAAGASAAGPTQATRLPSTTSAASLDRAEQVVGVRVVGDELADVGEQAWSWPQRPDRRVELAADLDLVAAAEHDPTVAHHLHDVGRGGGERRRVLVGAGAGGARAARCRG